MANKKLILGFSTGALYKTQIPQISREAVRLIKDLSCQALELGGQRKDRIPALNDLKPADVADFSFLSLHTADDVIYGDNAETKEMLDAIQRAHDRLKFDNIIIHPDKIESWEIFQHYSLPLAIENMDHRKSMGRTIDDIEKILNFNQNFKLVLDLNHCYCNDKTMGLAQDFYQKFKDKIVQIHLSGFIELHDPLYRSQQKEILDAVPDKNLPIIIESTLNDVSELKLEYEYIKNYLETN